MMEMCGDASRVFRKSESEKVELLVRDVITAISVRKTATKVARSSEVDNDVVNRLCEVSLLPDAAARIDFVKRLQSQGRSAQEITDVYIPAAARRMGARWSEDRMSFVEVTIGTARLQSLLRELGPEWRGDLMLHAQERSALMIVPMGCYHTLGAMVAMGQMRRMGLSVRLALGLDAPATVALVQSRRFDMVMLSVSSGACLDLVRSYVSGVRCARVPPVPVVIGGSVLFDHADICRLTGTDHATQDVAEAVALCGGAISAKENRREARNG